MLLLTDNRQGLNWLSLWLYPDSRIIRWEAGR